MNVYIYSQFNLVLADFDEQLLVFYSPEHSIWSLEWVIGLITLSIFRYILTAINCFDES